VNFGVSVSSLVIVLVSAMPLSGCRKEAVPHDHEAPSTPPSKLDAAGCNQIFDAAQRELQEALPRERACKANGDCDIVYTTVCNSDCGVASIPKRQVDAVEAKRKAIEATACRKYIDSDCPSITPRPAASCAVPSAICTSGNCALKPWAPP
jgi:hypothetical protein